MPEPCYRSPAQIEASRRNGARSRGPVTPEGKVRVSRNALKHGLAALHHVAVEGEDAAELAAMVGRLLAELAPGTELEARLVRRMAVAFWQSGRAERMEAALLAEAPREKYDRYGIKLVPVDPLATFDLQRFEVIRRYQAQQGREISRCLRELRSLRRDPLAEAHDEPDALLDDLRNEPEPGPPAANDDAPAVGVGEVPQPRLELPNEPEPLPPAGLPDPRLVEGSRLFDIWGQPRPHRPENPPAPAATPDLSRRLPAAC